MRPVTRTCAPGIPREVLSRQSLVAMETREQQERVPSVHCSSNSEGQISTCKQIVLLCILVEMCIYKKTITQRLYPQSFKVASNTPWKSFTLTLRDSPFLRYIYMFIIITYSKKIYENVSNTRVRSRSEDVRELRKASC